MFESARQKYLLIEFTAKPEYVWARKMAFAFRPVILIKLKPQCTLILPRLHSL